MADLTSSGAGSGALTVPDNLAADGGPEALGVGSSDTGPGKTGADQVLRSFNTWKFRRERPSEPELILRTISKAIAIKAPIQFVLYWGKGLRCAVAQPDIECLDFLASFIRRVGEGFNPGAAITLIFTDTHAELNGHSPTDLREYFLGIERFAQTRGFDTRWLSDLMHSVESTSQVDEGISKDLAARLTKSATKWYRGEGTAEEGVLKYYQVNMLEKQAVELAFPDSIFITFNSSQFRSVCPDGLPTFYMYARKRGFCIKPWFLPAPRDGGPDEPAGIAERPEDRHA